MNWPIEEYKITEIFLDQNNIRTPISDEDQNALINDMFFNEDAFHLVKSYSQNGIFPDEFPIIVIENKKKIMIEGNRRLAALKVLNEPDMLQAWKSRVKAVTNPHIIKIRVIIAPNREAAIKHIANKHTVNYRKPWKPLRQAYFYKSQLEYGKTIKDLIAEFPDHDIVKFIKMLEMHHLAKSMELDNALKIEIHNERKFPITTLERFYNDKNVAKFLGIGFNENGNVIGKIDKKEFEKGYKKIISDIADSTITSRTSNHTKERDDYINGLLPEYIPNKSKAGSFGSENFKEVKVKKESKKSSRSNKLPKGLFFSSSVPYKLSNTSLRFLYDEIRRISVADFPNATIYLLISFLECSIINFLKINDKYKEVKKNHHHTPSLSEMLTYLASKECKLIVDEDVKTVIKQVKSDYTSNYSLARMQMNKHNVNWNYLEKEVRVAWAKLESLFKILLSSN